MTPVQLEVGVGITTFGMRRLEELEWGERPGVRFSHVHLVKIFLGVPMGNVT
jgi:hypothetical protein